MVFFTVSVVLPAVIIFYRVCHAPGSNYLLPCLSCARQQLSFAASVVLTVVIALVFVHHGVDLVYDA